MVSLITLTLLIHIFADNWILNYAESYYYRKPSKLMFYQSGPPTYVYPSKQHQKLYHQLLMPSTTIADDHGLNAIIYPDVFYNDKKPSKYVKYKLVGKLNPGPPAQHIEDGWIGIAGKEEPVFGHYYTRGNKLVYRGYGLGAASPAAYVTSAADIGYTHHEDALLEAGVKPVVEHIEGDLKYDFRTKMHSYD